MLELYSPFGKKVTVMRDQVKILLAAGYTYENPLAIKKVESEPVLVAPVQVAKPVLVAKPVNTWKPSK